MWGVFFIALWLGTIWYYQHQQAPQPVVIGIPNAESREMVWLAKPEKTKWDEFKERVPAFCWGSFAGATVVLILML